MLYVLLFFAELVVLFFLSRRLQRRLGGTLYKLTKSKNWSIYIMAFLFLPGTFVHEMAHFLAALFLLVPVGNMELLPKIEDESIKLGSVGIAKTDPVRRFLIGAAPFFAGTSIILLIVYFVWNYFEGLQGIYTFETSLILISSLYLVFTVGNTMFSSKKDMEGMWGFLAMLFLTCLTLWILNININWSFIVTPKVSEYFISASLFLLVPLGLDIIAITLLHKK